LCWINWRAPKDFGCCRCFRVEKVRRVISRMGKGRMTGPDDEIPMKFYKRTYKVGVKSLTRLFNVIFKTTKMLDKWKWSTMV